MKQHLAILCGIAYPDASATGIVSLRFASLLAEYFDIQIICMSSDGEKHTAQIADNITVHALAGGTQQAEKRGRKLAHRWGQVQILTSMLGNLKWFAKAANAELCKLNGAKPLDCVFSVCSPMAAHTAAAAFKRSNPQVRWTAYTVDIFAMPERIKPVGKTFRDMQEYELSVLQQADEVLLSDEIYGRHPQWTELLKAEALPYILPLRESNTEHTDLLEDDYVNFVFAGSFYESIRNPEPMLAAFRAAGGKCRLHLFSTGCEETVEKYRCDAIVQHGRVPYETVKAVYAQADALVNIGNRNADFTPSKVFEYLATGKPILNFYYGEQPNEALAKYPMAYHIPNRTEETAAARIDDFAAKCKGKTVDRNTIEEIYSRHTAKSVTDLLRRTIGGPKDCL